MTTKLKITIILLPAVVVILFLWLITRTNNPSVNPPINTSPSSDTTTVEDAELSSDTIKTTNIENNDADLAEDSITNEVAPVIVYLQVVSDRLEIGSYIPVVDEGGRCTVVLTHLESKHISTYESASSPSASTTDCEAFSIPISQLDSGATSVVITYSSNNHSGSSLSSEVVIP